ncbi:tRNA pseudouridine synthase [Schizopora paradoxa]|uniref:tRNA pseudouridine synthase n=1 Tax=Schizopora paradoxa TaxID=27342 RepID=A0A0H2RXV3_9AGAM|nr:tRNA pseudouridine synthase [Schizopora paradoxa]
MASPSYETWSKEDLIARLKLLDATLPTSRTHTHPKQLARKTKTAKTFDFASQPRRKIALKFCYAGWEYNGLAFQKDKTPLPTVEGTLFKALSACRLVDPEAGPEGCGWERCGRTDRGVSSAGQVVSLWVRSNQAQFLPEAARPLADEARVDESPIDSITEAAEDSELPLFGLSDSDDALTPSPAAQFQNLDELPYVSMLNRVLPPTIRIYAWAPVSPTFSSRFACRNRHYKYIFTSDGLDISKMRDAAERLLGENDFRNLCKLDASKQIVSFKRKILRADISPVSIFVKHKNNAEGSSTSSNQPPEGEIYVFDLIGTAFLYHQVRYIMAILFLVGSGLEPPSAMTALLNADPSNPLPPFREGEEVPEVVECKPEYQMADGLPLMLWNCAYNEEDVVWQTGGSSTSEEETTEDADASETMGEKNLYNQVHSIHSRSLIHAALDAHFFHAVSTYHSPQTNPFPLAAPTNVRNLGNDLVLSIPVGGGCFRRWTSRTYVPLLQRKRLEPVEVVNERWRQSKGLRRENRKANAEDQADE